MACLSFFDHEAQCYSTEDPEHALYVEHRSCTGSNRGDHKKGPWINPREVYRELFK